MKEQTPKIEFINVDLDLESKTPFDNLVKVFEKSEIVLHYEGSKRKCWFARIEVSFSPRKPETAVLHLCRLVKNLSGIELQEWNSCYMREFNLGYHCGEKPWAYPSALSKNAVLLMSQVQASLAITLYPPDRSEGP